MGHVACFFRPFNSHVEIDLTVQPDRPASTLREPSPRLRRAPLLLPSLLRAAAPPCSGPSPAAGRAKSVRPRGRPNRRRVLRRHRGSGDAGDLSSRGGLGPAAWAVEPLAPVPRGDAAGGARTAARGGAQTAATARGPYQGCIDACYCRRGAASTLQPGRPSHWRPSRAGMLRAAPGRPRQEAPRQQPW